jgi:hypothetical protein
MRRIAVAAALLVVTMTVLSALSAPPAPAVGRQTEVITRLKGLDKTYPGFTGQFPSSPDPDICSQPTSNFCDTIPLDIQEPTDIPPGDDFYLEIIVSWPGGVDVDDLDIVLYDNGQTQKEIDDQGTREPTDPPRTSPYTNKGQANEGHPLRIVLAEPRLRFYNLVVVHFGGFSESYRVRATMIVGKFEAPFESLERPDDLSDTGSDSTPITDNSADPSGPDVSVTAQPSTDGTITLPDVVPGLDTELDALLSRRRMPAAVVATEGALPTANVAPPASPSAIALLFWLALVPGSLLGGFAFWLAKRRRAGFTFG